jgi:hypothetical protein
VTGVQRQARQNESNQERWGIRQDIDAERTSISRMQLSISHSILSLRGVFYPQIKTVIARISFFLYNIARSSSPFLKPIFLYDQISQIYFLQIYIEI